MKYRKKPVVIEAVQFVAANFDEIEDFVGGDAEFRSGELIVATLEGPLRAAPGDWIIKGIQGEFYPCKPDIFAATYEDATRADIHADLRAAADALAEAVRKGDYRDLMRALAAYRAATEKGG